MKAVRKFKDIMPTKRPEILDDILGQRAHIVQPPQSLMSPTLNSNPRRSRSMDSDDRKPIEKILAAEGVHRDVDRRVVQTAEEAPGQELGPQAHAPEREADPSRTWKRSPHTVPSASPPDHGKGHAHDPLTDQLFLAVGPGGAAVDDTSSPDPPIVSESPPATDVDIYGRAYHEEIERIRRMHGGRATTYLTRRVEENGDADLEHGCSPAERSGGERNERSGFGGVRLAKALQLVKRREKERDED